MANRQQRMRTMIQRSILFALAVCVCLNATHSEALAPPPLSEQSWDSCDWRWQLWQVDITLSYIDRCVAIIVMSNNEGLIKFSDYQLSTLKKIIMSCECAEFKTSLIKLSSGLTIHNVQQFMHNAYEAKNRLSHHIRYELWCDSIFRKAA